jgi:tRNA(fMet)-specific endonuclease VapC
MSLIPILSRIFYGRIRFVKEKLLNAVSGGSQIIISAIVHYEIRRGLLSVFAPMKTLAYEKLYRELKAGIIDPQTAEIAAVLYVRLSKAGQIIEDDDLLIAACCIQNQATLVTNNIKHFENIRELDIENWTV